MCVDLAKNLRSWVKKKTRKTKRQSEKEARKSDAMHIHNIQARRESAVHRKHQRHDTDTTIGAFSIKLYTQETAKIKIDPTMSDDNIMAVEPEDEAVPMESSEDAPAAEDDQTTGDGSTGTSDVASGDGDEDESKSVSTTTNNTNAPAEEDGVVGEEDEDEEEEDDAEQKSVGSGGMEEEDAEEETKSVAADENDNDMEETETAINEPALETASPASTPAVVAPPVKKKRGKPQIPASARKGRAPAVKGLNIPFRTVKKVSWF